MAPLGIHKPRVFSMALAAAFAAAVAVTAAPAALSGEGGDGPKISPETVVKVRRLLRSWVSESEQERQEAWQGIKDMGDLATPALAEVVKSGENNEERRQAIVAIGLLEDRLGADAVRGALKDEDPEIRWRAARTLGEVGDKKSKEALAAAIASDENAEVRYYAAYSLAGLGGEEAFVYLKKLVAEGDVEERARAVRAIGKYGGPKRMDDVAAALKDPDSRVRRAAVVQLDVARCKEATPGLIEALADEDYEVRKRARGSLERTTGQNLGDDQAKWQEWWKENGKSFKPLAKDRGPAPIKFASAKPVIGEEEFKKKVAESKGLVAVLFYVSNDRDCSEFAPVFDKLAAELRGKVELCAAEAMANLAKAKELGLRKAPSTVIFKDGQKVEVVVGPKEEAELRTILEEHLAGTRKVPEPEPEPVPVAAAEEKQLFPDVADEADFEKQVTGAKGLVLVDFHAEWCVWCHRLKPILNRLHTSNADRVKIVGVDTEKLGELKEKYGVEGLPTMIIFKDGEQAEKVVGYKPEADLRAIIDAHLPEGGKLHAGDEAPGKAGAKDGGGEKQPKPAGGAEPAPAEVEPAGAGQAQEKEGAE